MSDESRNKREKLKEEYKEHYRKMRDARERLKSTQKKRNIMEALKSMDSTEIMESFDSFLVDIKSKVAHAEARLDIALGDIDDPHSSINEAENEEAFDKVKAKETLKQLKNEMGLLHRQLEAQAKAIHVEKTVGRAEKEDSPHSSSSNNE